MNETELAGRSVIGFGEIMAALGQGSGGPNSVIRFPNAIGARIDLAATNPWFSGLVVPIGSQPPQDDHRDYPNCIWTIENSVPGRVESNEIATPCLGLALSAFQGASDSSVEPCPLDILGDINERAYGDFGVFKKLVLGLRNDAVSGRAERSASVTGEARLSDSRISAFGIRDSGVFVCVALALRVNNDLSIHYVATESSHRRHGMATRLVSALMSDAKKEGLTSATLQASAEGLPVWQRLGFRTVATLRAYIRAENTGVPE
jgi:ribosomal protein S18 acetylase RimI-like enzyme